MAVAALPPPYFDTKSSLTLSRKAIGICLPTDSSATTQYAVRCNINLPELRHKSTSGGQRVAQKVKNISRIISTPKNNTQILLPINIQLPNKKQQDSAAVEIEIISSTFFPQGCWKEKKKRCGSS